MMNTALASVLPPMLRMVRRAVLRTDPARHSFNLFMAGA